MFISDALTEPERRVIDLGQVEMVMVGVGSYEAACEEAKKLVDEGAVMIELCAAFGVIGHAKVTEAVAGKLPVGVVRFDTHPGFNNASGDSKWLI
jgi:hypothetical protein